MRAPDITYLTDIYFGFGSVARVPELVARFGILRPLVVTDAALVGLGMVERLAIGKPETFADTETNPTEANLQACLARYLERGCDGSARRFRPSSRSRPPPGAAAKWDAPRCSGSIRGASSAS